MGECIVDDMPLPALFDQARKIHETATESVADQVNSTPLNAPFFIFSFFVFCLIVFGFSGWLRFVQELVKKGIVALQKCEEMVNKLGLFSANETKDDISTANLKYILVLVPASSHATSLVSSNY
jgi:hypothetical protein